MKLKFMQAIDKFFSYIPIALIGLYVLIHTEGAHQHSRILTYITMQFLFVLTLWFLFYNLHYTFNIDIDVSFIISCVVWIVFTTFRNKLKKRYYS